MREIVDRVDIWLMVFMRVIASVLYAPIFVDVKIPTNVTVGLSVALSTMAFMTMGDISVVYNPTILGFTLVIIKEAVVGLIMAFSVSLFFQVYHFVGSLISTQGGLSMSTIFDNSTGSQITLVGKLYHMQLCVVFIMYGGLHWFISAIMTSFEYIPVGQATFSGDLMHIMVQGVALFWSIGFQISAPILAVLFIVDAGMGILARTVPQLNMFVIGIPLKVLILLIMLFITVPLVESFNGVVIEAMSDILEAVIRGMAP